MLQALVHRGQTGPESAEGGRRARASPARDHRSVERGAQPMSDGRGGTSSPTTARSTTTWSCAPSSRAWRTLHVDLRHRSAARRLRRLGRGLPRAAERNVRVRDLGPRRGRAVLRPRPARREAVHLRAGRAALRVRERAQGAARAGARRRGSLPKPCTSTSRAGTRPGEASRRDQSAAPGQGARGDPAGSGPPGGRPPDEAPQTATVGRGGRNASCSDAVRFGSEATCRSARICRADSTRAPCSDWRRASRAGNGVAFTGAFAEAIESDERRFAREVNAHGGPGHEVEIALDEFARVFERMVWHLDEPIAGPGVFPQMAVC